MIFYQNVVVVKSRTLHFNQHYQKEMIQFCQDYKIEYKINVNNLLNEVQLQVKGSLYMVEALEEYLNRLNEGFGEYIKEINTL